MPWNASQLVLRLTKGPIDCTEDNVDVFNDIQENVSCHVCLSTGAVVGLAFHAQTGLISLVALLALLYIVARNYIRNHRKPPPGPWRLFRGNVDILMLNLIVADIIMSLGAISDIRWAYDRQVYCGSFCDAQGIVQTLGETAAALSTLAVAIYTFIAVNSRRPPVYRPWLCWITVVIIWLWCILWPVILLRKYDAPGPGGEEDVHYAYTPTPWWCWINSKYLPERIVAEYLWLWIAGIFSIGLYIPAYYIVRNQQNMFREPAPDADRRSVASTIDETNEAVKMLWYPLAYTLCVLPLSIMRWAAFANPDLLNRSQVMPATMVFSSIFNLMGLINVLLIYWTRPAILLIGSDGTLPHTDPRYTLSKEEVSPNSSLQSLPPNGNIGQDSHQASSRRGDNGFGGENVSLPREPVA